MVTTVKFKDKKRSGTTWVNGKPVRFKNGVATVQDDEDAKKLAKKEGYEILKDNSLDTTENHKKDKKERNSRKKSNNK